MAEGRGRDAWARASEIISAIWNANTRLKTKKVFEAADFSPYETPKLNKGTRLTKKNIHVLKAFLPRHKRKELDQ